MRNVVSLLLVSALLFFSQSVHAEAMLTGAGAHQCGKYLDLLEGSETEQLYADIAFGAWLQGYLSGRNDERSRSGKGVVDIEGHQGHERWLVNYCRENPLDYVWLGADALWETLKSRQGIEK